MKLILSGFLLLIINFCTVSISAQNAIVKTAPNGLENKIEDLIEYYVYNTKTEFDKIYFNINYSVNRTVTQFADKKKEYDKGLDGITANTQVTINQNINKGGAFRKCAEEQLPYFRNVSAVAKNNLNLCHDAYIRSLREHESFNYKNLKEVENYIIDLRLGVVGCLHLNPVATTSCVVDKVQNYLSLIRNIGNIQIKSTTDQGSDAVKLLNNCYVNIYNILKYENEMIMRNYASSCAK